MLRRIEEDDEAPMVAVGVGGTLEKNVAEEEGFFLSCAVRFSANGQKEVYTAQLRECNRVVLGV